MTLLAALLIVLGCTVLGLVIGFVIRSATQSVDNDPRRWALHSPGWHASLSPDEKAWVAEEVDRAWARDARRLAGAQRRASRERQ